MANEVEIVVSSKDKTDFGAATRGAKNYGEGLGKVGEKADASEQKVLGMKDTVDGVATIMQGPGKQGIAAYLQGWADLASGVANFIIPAVQATVAIARQGVATIVTTAAQKAAAVGAKAWAAAQWLLNAALNANPIGIIVLLIAGLVAAIVIAYKKSETFRNIVQGAFKAIGTAAKVMWENFIKPAFEALKPAFKVIGEAAKGLWDHVLKPTFKFIVNGFLTLVGAIIDGAAKAFGWIPGIGPKLKEAAKAFNNFKVKVNNALNGVVDHKDIVVRVKDQATGAIRTIQREVDRMTGRVLAIQVGRVGIGPRAEAHGGIVGAASGGIRNRLTMVGEHGPELVDLPPGTRVRSNSDSRRLMGGGGGGQPLSINLILDGKKIAEVMLDPFRNIVRTKGGNVQAVLGS